MFSPIRLCLRGPNFFLRENCCNVRGYSLDPRAPQAVSSPSLVDFEWQCPALGTRVPQENMENVRKTQNIWKLKVKTCFVTKSVWFGHTELLVFFPKSSPRDLQFGHGFRACALKNKGNKWNFILLGVKPSFATKSVRFGRTELSICRTCRESRDLQIDHGFRACLKKKWKENVGFSHFRC